MAQDAYHTQRDCHSSTQNRSLLLHERLFQLFPGTRTLNLIAMGSLDHYLRRQKNEYVIVAADRFLKLIRTICISKNTSSDVKNVSSSIGSFRTSCRQTYSRTVIRNLSANVLPFCVIISAWTIYLQPSIISTQTEKWNCGGKPLLQAFVIIMPTTDTVGSHFPPFTYMYYSYVCRIISNTPFSLVSLVSTRLLPGPRTFYNRSAMASNSYDPTILRHQIENDSPESMSYAIIHTKNYKKNTINTRRTTTWAYI